MSINSRNEEMFSPAQRKKSTNAQKIINMQRNKVAKFEETHKSIKAIFRFYGIITYAVNYPKVIIETHARWVEELKECEARSVEIKNGANLPSILPSSASEMYLSIIECIVVLLKNDKLVAELQKVIKIFPDKPNLSDSKLNETGMEKIQKSEQEKENDVFKYYKIKSLLIDILDKEKYQSVCQAINQLSEKTNENTAKSCETFFMMSRYHEKSLKEQIQSQKQYITLFSSPKVSPKLKNKINPSNINNNSNDNNKNLSNDKLYGVTPNNVDDDLIAHPRFIYHSATDGSVINGSVFADNSNNNNIKNDSGKKEESTPALGKNS